VAGGTIGGNGWQPVANGLATDSPLSGNEISSPVARWHEFSEGIEAAEDFPPVCAHCGGPGTGDAPVLPCAVDGNEVLLHPACRADWFEDDLAIPAFLQRTLKEEN
jgi:hypothetical protein